MPSPVVFKLDHNFHAFRLDFDLEALLTEDETGSFDIKISYKKGTNYTTIIDKKFHINIAQNFTIPGISIASLHLELSGAGVNNGHAAVRLKAGVNISALISHTFTVIDQVLTTALLTSEHIEMMKAAGSPIKLGDLVGDEPGGKVMMAFPTQSSFSITSDGGGDNAFARTK